MSSVIEEAKAIIAAGAVATPGPWSVNPSSNAGDRLHRPGITQSDLCIEPEADCHFIAAARPADRVAVALLRAVEVIQACVKYMPCSEVRDWPPGFEMKRNAIAGAEAFLTAIAKDAP